MGSKEIEFRAPNRVKEWGQANSKQRMRRFSRKIEFPTKASPGIRHSRSQDNLLSLVSAAGYELEEEEQHSADATRDKRSPGKKKAFGIRPSVTRELKQMKRHTPVSEYVEDTGEENPQEDEEQDLSYQEV